MRTDLELLKAKHPAAYAELARELRRCLDET
jgi:hypothetical protein